MLKSLGRVLNFKKEEGPKILILVLLSLFFGIFISYYNSYITAQFLEEFDRSFYTYAYLASGIIGLITTFFYSYLLRKLSYITHSFLTMFAIILFVLLLKLGIDYSKTTDFLDIFFFKNFYEGIKIVSFIGFIFYTPIISTIALLYSGLLMKMFDLRQGKRLFALIGSGAVIAAIISYLSVPILIPQLSKLSSLLWFALFGISFGFAIKLVIYKKYADYFKVSNTEKGKKIAKINIFQNKYYKNIFSLSFLSMMGLILVSFSFLCASKDFFSDEGATGLSMFFGFFYGASKIIEFLLNTFLSGKLLEKYGLKFGLSVLPKTLLATSIIAILLLFVTSELGTIAFIVIALSMLFLIVLKRCLEDAAFKMLFQPLDSYDKVYVQTNTEGRARQIGAIFAGGILVTIQLIVPEHLLISCLSLLGLVTTFWIFNVTKVFVQYKKFISKKLDNIQVNTVNTFQGKNFVSTLTINSDHSKNSFLNLVLPGVYHLNRTKNSSHIDFDFFQLSEVSQKKIDHIDTMSNNWVESHYNEIIRMLEDDDHFVVDYLIFTFNTKITSKSFKRFIESEKNHFTNRLILLLHLIDYNFLNSQKEIEFSLSTITNTNISLNLSLIDIISNGDFIDLMLNRLESKNVDIESRIISGLLKQKVKSTELEYLLIKNKIEDEVSNYNWIITALLDLNNESQCKELIDLLELELDISTYRIFKLTALIYDDAEISKIINIIQDDTSENILAIELVDILFDEEFKEYLIPIIDDLDLNEKYSKLNNYFPKVRLNPTDRLKSILNLEYERLNVWIRLKSMELLIFQKSKEDFPSEIMSNLYNKDLILREGAFYCLSKVSKEKFSFYFEKDTSKVKELYSDTYDYLEGVLNVYELYDCLKNSLFLTDITELEIIKILRITNHKIHSKSVLESIDIGNSAFLILGGNDKTNDFQKLDPDIKQNSDLLIFTGKSLSKFKDFCHDDIKMLKIDATALINIIASSESLNIKV